MATIEAMSTSQTMTNVTRNLPMSLTGEVERLGYSILRSLDRLGFVHANQDGGVFTIRFDAVRLYGETWAAYHVDAERLYHFSVSDLAKRDVLAQLSAVTRKPVRAFDDGGLAYVVELQPKPKVSLPDNVTLDLGQRPDGELLVPLGVGRDGTTWRALPKLGHALIVGTTGAGKSTWLHAALAALLTSERPDQLRLALIDPKRSEFTAWAGAPHLVGEIAHDETQATKLLADLVHEVDRRGDLFGAAVCRDIVAYNKAVLSPQVADPLPYILIAIDECLDLVLFAGSKSDLASYLKTIAIRGRSAGVVLWAATQHPAAVTGLPRVVNTNLTARLVFRVADQSAAMAAGCPGAESIPRDKPGRLLAKIDSKPVELQAYHLPDADLARVASVVCNAVAGTPAAGRSGPTLTTTEVALVTWAIESNGGYLGLGDIQARGGMGTKAARRLAEQWERRGWLVKDASKGNRRRVSDDLMGRVSG